tara:strand:+ start:75 stop:221 length:147 start_codon:yes stop_codon:yes gene_type:complete
MKEYNPFGSGTKEQLERQWDAVEADKQEALALIRAKKKERESNNGNTR